MSSSAQKMEIFASGLRFPEGPVALRDGSVLVVEIAGRALTRVFEGGEVQPIATLEGGPNGAAMGPDGWVYVCNSGGWTYGDLTLPDGRVLQRPLAQRARPGWIERVHLPDGRTERLHEACEGWPLQSPNDLVFDADGGYYFSDHGKRDDRRLGLGRVFYGHADGRPLRAASDALVTPNGVGLSPDGRTLYVAETLTRRLLAFDIEAPGRLRSRPWPAPGGGRLVSALPGFNGLDSMAIDATGNVHIASLVNGGIWSISPDGTASSHTPIDDPFTTNLCFGGPDMTSLFVTLSASGRLARLPAAVAGLRLHFN